MKTLTVLTILTAAVVVTATLLGCGEGQEMGMEIGKDIISESDAPNPAPTATKVAEVKKPVKEEGLEPTPTSEPETEPLEPEPEVVAEPIKEPEPTPEPEPPLEPEPEEVAEPEPTEPPGYDITFRVVEPLLPEGITTRQGFPLPTSNGPGIGSVEITPVDGLSESKTKKTANDGSVTIRGFLPLTVMVEKEGYIPTEAIINENGQEVLLPNEWPEELQLMIEHFGWTEKISAGEIILYWGADDYLRSVGSKTGSLDFCRQGGGGIFIVGLRSRAEMLWGLVYDAFYSWIADTMMEDYECGHPDGYQRMKASNEAQAWKKVLAKDLAEVGPLRGFDDIMYLGSLMQDRPLDNYAAFYAEWYLKGATIRNHLKRVAPNRHQYLEDKFGLAPEGVIDP